MLGRPQIGICSLRATIGISADLASTDSERRETGFEVVSGGASRGGGALQGRILLIVTDDPGGCFQRRIAPPEATGHSQM